MMQNSDQENSEYGHIYAVWDLLIRLGLGTTGYTSGENKMDFKFKEI